MKKDKSNTTDCERLCLAGAVAPSFNCWLTARLFSGRALRNSSWRICILTLSSILRKIEKLGDFYSYRILFIYTGSKIFIPDPIYLYQIQNIHTGSSELFSAIDCTKDLFLPDPKYSYRILFYLYWIRNIHTGSYFIHTGSEFTELLLTILESSNIIVNRPLVWKIICTGSENTWVKPSNWLIL